MANFRITFFSYSVLNFRINLLFRTVVVIINLEIYALFLVHLGSRVISHCLPCFGLKLELKVLKHGSRLDQNFQMFHYYVALDKVINNHFFEFCCTVLLFNLHFIL